MIGRIPETPPRTPRSLALGFLCPLCWAVLVASTLGSVGRAAEGAAPEGKPAPETKPRTDSKLTPEQRKQMREKILRLVDPAPLSEDERAALGKLVKDWGSPKFAVREEASKRALEFGKRALPVLREAAKHQDPEVADRAGNAIKKIVSRDEEDALVRELRETPKASLAILDALLQERREAVGKRKTVLAEAKGKKPAEEDDEVQRLTAVVNLLVALRRRVARPDYLSEARAHFAKGKYAEAEKSLQNLIRDGDPQAMRKAQMGLMLARMAKRRQERAGKDNPAMRAMLLKQFDAMLGILPKPVPKVEAMKEAGP